MFLKKDISRALATLFCGCVHYYYTF